MADFEEVVLIDDVRTPLPTLVAPLNRPEPIAQDEEAPEPAPAPLPQVRVVAKRRARAWPPRIQKAHFTPHLVDCSI